MRTLFFVDQWSLQKAHKISVKNFCCEISVLYFRFTGLTKQHPLPNWFERWTIWSGRVKFGMSELVMCRVGRCRRSWIQPKSLGVIPGFLCRWEMICSFCWNYLKSSMSIVDKDARNVRFVFNDILKSLWSLKSQKVHCTKISDQEC